MLRFAQHDKCWLAAFLCHAEPFGFAQDKLREAESKHLIPWDLCITSLLY